MGTFGDFWGPIGTFGELLGPMGTYGVGGITFLHTHFDTNPPPPRPFLQASHLYQTYHTSCGVQCKNNMPYQTSDITLYTQSWGQTGHVFKEEFLAKDGKIVVNIKMAADNAGETWGGIFNVAWTSPNRPP